MKLMPRRPVSKMEKTWRASTERKDLLDAMKEAKKARTQKLIAVMKANVEAADKESNEYLAARAEWEANERRNGNSES